MGLCEQWAEPPSYKYKDMYNLNYPNNIFKKVLALDNQKVGKHPEVHINAHLLILNKNV